MSTVYKSGSIAIADYPKDRIEFQWRGLQCFLLSCSSDNSTWSYNENTESYDLEDVNFMFTVIINGIRWEVNDIELQLHESTIEKEEVLKHIEESLDDNDEDILGIE